MLVAGFADSVVLSAAIRPRLTSFPLYSAAGNFALFVRVLVVLMVAFAALTAPAGVCTLLVAHDEAR